MRNMRNYKEQYNNQEDPGNLFEQNYQVKYRQRIVSDSLKKYKHDCVLEVGCAMDSQANHIHDVKEYVIVEPCGEFIEKAKTDLKRKNVSFINGFLENEINTLIKWNFDFIIVGSLLHELENPNDIIKKLHDISDKDTVIHVNVPNAKSFHRLLGEASGLVKNIYSLTDRNKQFQQHKVFDMEQLTLFIEQNGGKILDRGGLFIKPFTHTQMMQCLQENIISPDILDGLNKMAEFFPELASEIYVNFRFL